MTYFPPELRTAGVVPRWSVVWTLTRDVVSNHSFFVTFYAHQIARMIEWGGNYADLMYRALTHDLDETITGDIVSPVKKEIIDSKAAAAYIDRKMRERLGTVVARTDEMGYTGEIDKIVKAADCLDALLFLVVEKRMGNGVIEQQIPRGWTNMAKVWDALPAPHGTGPLAWETMLSEMWRDILVPAVKQHEHSGGFGV